MKRLDANKIEAFSDKDLSVTIYANENVEIENSAIVELKEFCEVVNTVKKLKEVNYLKQDSKILKISVSSDFHRGSGIPIGVSVLTKNVVIPGAVGNDCGCGINNTITDVTIKDFALLSKKDIADKLRYIYFEGGRTIPTNSEMRKIILEKGLKGILSFEFKNEINSLKDKGIWEYLDYGDFSSDLGKFSQDGDYKYLFSEYVESKSVYDTQLGSIGGGNHFVEWQSVIQNSYNTFGMKSGFINIMSHSGSVTLGHSIWNVFEEKLKKDYPKGLKKPIKDFYLVDFDSEIGSLYLKVLNGAINFAAVNRFLLTLMSLKGLSELLNRKVKYKIVWDLPHNWIEDKNNNEFLHRKGTCPCYENDPVIIPGSMGSSSFIMKGLGNSDALFSGPHGAGRKTKRGEGRKELIPSDIFIITKLSDSIQRKDIRDKYNASLAEESPSCYKDITPTIETMESALIAERVSELKPILTIKGL